MHYNYFSIPLSQASSISACNLEIEAMPMPFCKAKRSE